VRDSARWLTAGVLAVVCAVAGVFVASIIAPRVEPRVTPSPVVVAVTTTATAHPSTDPAPVASPDGINLSQHSIDEAGSLWVVVNKRRPLSPLEYAPADLTTINAPGGGQLTAAAAAAVREMYLAASEAGAPFRTSTAYRSYNFQKGLFNQYVASDGVERAETYSARPGYSEHQTGLGIDVYDPSGCHLKKCFAETPSGKWLVAHAAEFGFIERYPEGATDITGYTWEPWHWRYVGVELAEYMRDQNIETLEELFGLPAAPDYG
jgi:D-alanyl-D-alanine carboxypeptidase